MNKLLYLLPSLFFISCTQSRSTEVIEKYSDGSTRTDIEYLDKNDSSCFIIRDYYRSGTVEFEGKICNDRFVEFKRVYFENGQPKEHVTLTSSAELDYCCPDGEYRMYHENGQLMQTHTRVNGLFEGMVTKYDTLGKIRAEYQVAKDLKNGIAKKYYTNGVVRSIREYRNDTLVGKQFFFTETGDSLKRTATYNGHIDFPIKYWKENGSSLRGEYANGNHFQVQWTWIDSTGNITKTAVVDTVNGTFVTPEY